MYVINVKTITSRSKNSIGIIKEDIKQEFLNCKDFAELREVFKNNKALIKDILKVELYPSNISDRVKIISMIKEDKEKDIKVETRLKGMFVEIKVII